MQPRLVFWAVTSVAIRSDLRYATPTRQACELVPGLSEVFKIKPQSAPRGRLSTIAVLPATDTSVLNKTPISTSHALLRDPLLWQARTVPKIRFSSRWSGNWCTGRRRAGGQRTLEIPGGWPSCLAPSRVAHIDSEWGSLVCLPFKPLGSIQRSITGSSAGMACP